MINRDVNQTQRLCIYVTYNKEYKVKEYMGYMLKSLRECVTSLYVVCNYPEIMDGYEYIRSYADAVFYRENNGYDAGAYKDMLCTVLGWDVVCEYDELILMNDSFFGPFWDLSGYFAMMEDEKWDFWGMTRQPAGELSSLKYKFGPHIQSYFLVCSKRIIQSFPFRNFWEDYIPLESFEETIVKFEIALSECLENSGFISRTLTEVKGITFTGGGVAFLKHPFELIKDAGFPFLKKKSLLMSNKGFANALKAIEFIENQKLYPVNWIWEQLDSQFYIENYAPKKANCLEAFCNKFNKVYIYGAGVCGKNLVLYFEKKGWKQDGVLVSDKSGQDIECIAFKEAEIDDETGILVSVINQDVSEEIVQYIGSKCTRDQLFLLSDCVALRIPK